MKIGIFGGTFNPPHHGHLIVAEEVRIKLAIDKIIFIPSYITPLKQGGESQNAFHRLEMTKLAISDNIHFECSDIEINRHETSFTINTLERLVMMYPSDQFFLLIGMDNYHTFHLWKDPDKISRMVNILVMNRPGFHQQINTQLKHQHATFVEVPNIDVSSSDIRKRIKEKLPISKFVPKKVEEYINTHSLFV